MRGLAVASMFALLVSLPAYAGDNKTDSDRLFTEGLHLFEQKDFVGARQKFADAYAKYPSPNSLLNLARSEQLSSRCIDAVAHYRAYIALPDNPRISAGDRGSARIKLNECLGKIGHIQVTAPASARVSVDGMAAAWTLGESIDVTPGEHRIEIAVEGATKTRTTTTAEGQVASVQWEDPPPPPPPEIKLPEVKPIPEVRIVEVPATPLPPQVVQTPPEKPHVWKDETRWPTAKVGSAIALGVLTVGSFIAAPSLLAGSLGNARSADALANKLGPSGCSTMPLPADCVTLAGERSAQNNFAIASGVFFTVGALAIIGAIVVVVAWPNIHPLVTATERGLAISF
jgi:hypothetical protein